MLFLVIGSHTFTLHSVLSAGFGNISPHTEGGRIFCIVYALLGIPLFGFLLAGVGDQLGTIFSKGIGRVEEMFVVSLEKRAQSISLEVRLIRATLVIYYCENAHQSITYNLILFDVLMEEYSFEICKKKSH